MPWPLMWTTTHAMLIARQQEQLQAAHNALIEAIVERRYWQKKAEMLLDHALFKRGEITAPVFQEPEKKSGTDPMTRMMGALGITEIESARPAGPVPPMT